MRKSVTSIYILKNSTIIVVSFLSKLFAKVDAILLPNSSFNML